MSPRLAVVGFIISVCLAYSRGLTPSGPNGSGACENGDEGITMGKSGELVVPPTKTFDLLSRASAEKELDS